MGKDVYIQQKQYFLFQMIFHPGLNKLMFMCYTDKYIPLQIKNEWTVQHFVLIHSNVVMSMCYNFWYSDDQEMDSKTNLCIYVSNLCDHWFKW